MSMDNNVANINLVLYNFTILIDLQYNKSEFKKLLIDLDKATRLTSNIG